LHGSRNKNKKQSLYPLAKLKMMMDSATCFTLGERLAVLEYAIFESSQKETTCPSCVRTYLFYVFVLALLFIAFCAGIVAGTKLVEAPQSDIVFNNKNDEDKDD